MSVKGAGPHRGVFSGPYGSRRGLDGPNGPERSQGARRSRWAPVAEGPRKVPRIPTGLPNELEEVSGPEGSRGVYSKGHFQDPIKSHYHCRFNPIIYLSL